MSNRKYVAFVLIVGFLMSFNLAMGVSQQRVSNPQSDLQAAPSATSGEVSGGLGLIKENTGLTTGTNTGLTTGTNTGLTTGTNSAMPDECDCIVDQVANMGTRVHVHCQTPETSAIKPSPFAFFALPLDSPLVNTFTIMGQAVAMQNLNRQQELTDFCAYTAAGDAVGCKPNSGLISGKLKPYGLPYTLHIWYDAADTSGTSFGCQSDSCRKPQAFGILE